MVPEFHHNHFLMVELCLRKNTGPNNKYVIEIINYHDICLKISRLSNFSDFIHKIIYVLVHKCVRLAHSTV